MELTPSTASSFSVFAIRNSQPVGGVGDQKARRSWTAPRSSVDASIDDPFECEEGGNTKAGIIHRDNLSFCLSRFII